MLGIIEPPSLLGILCEVNDIVKGPAVTYHATTLSLVGALIEKDNNFFNRNKLIVRPAYDRQGAEIDCNTNLVHCI